MQMSATACFRCVLCAVAAYYRGAQGIILLYDVSDPTEASFTSAFRRWDSGDVRAAIGTERGPRVDSVVV